jgi:hypothetical protein
VRRVNTISKYFMTTFFDYSQLPIARFNILYDYVSDSTSTKSMA